MILLADENVDKPIIDLLRVNGFKVDDAEDGRPSAAYGLRLPMCWKCWLSA